MTTLADAQWLYVRTGGQIRPEILEQVEDTACPEYDNEECMNCGEHPSLIYPVPCPSGCCDRALCLDCADRLGHDITE